MAWKYLTRGKTQTPLSTGTNALSDLVEQPQSAIEAQGNESIPSGNQELKDPQTVFPKDPILSAEDELFLQRISSNFEVPPLPPGKTVITDGGEMTDVVEGADQIPLPLSPGESNQTPILDVQSENEKQSWAAKYWSFVPDRVVAAAPNIKMPELLHLPQMSDLSQLAHLPQMAQFSLFGRKSQSKAQEANSDAKSSSTDPATVVDVEKSEEEQKKEARDLSMILSNLDLSAINNRVIGVSKDSQRLLENFTLILKDVLNGAPSAYDDLEKLLTDRQAQLDKMYNSLPPFLQSLVQSVPTKMYAFLAPQLVAAVAAAQEGKAKGAGGVGIKAMPNSQAKGKEKRKMTSYIPNLRSLITQRGAVAAMLRSIISFLELRFPMLLAGTNVIMSLAVFLLLFVFWYCHKRGKEARLERTKAEDDLEASVDQLAEKLALADPESEKVVDEAAPITIEEATPVSAEEILFPAEGAPTTKQAEHRFRPKLT